MRKPWRQAKDFFRSVVFNIAATWRQMRAADVPILAGSLAFSSVIALVPLLAVSLSVFKAYGGFEVLMKQLEPFILENLVEASGAHASRFIRASIVRIESGALGVIGVIGLLLTSTKVFFDIEIAVQRVWQEKARGFRWRRLFVYWTVMFIGPLLLATALGIIGSRGLDLVQVIPKKSVVFVCVFAAFACINKLVPAAKVAWRAVIVSSLFAAGGIALAQQFYARVTVDILRFSKIYGSLASIPIFLIWILVLWWISLASFALCAVLEANRIRERRRITPRL